MAASANATITEETTCQSGPSTYGNPLSIHPKRIMLYLGQGFHDLPVYDAQALGASARISGPAILELPTTTIMLLKDQKGEIDALGNLLGTLKR